jgi:putative transposase
LAAQTNTALKSIKQHLEPPTPELLQMMKTFRIMVNDCIRIGLENDASTRIKLTKLCYHQLARYKIYSVYKLCAISHAAGILANGKKFYQTRLSAKTAVCSKTITCCVCWVQGCRRMLKVPLGNRQYFDIPLNDYVKHILSDPS